jgi:Phycobilisome degradation protein nblA
MSLTLEQELNVRVFEIEVKKVSREQAHDLLVQFYRHILKRENAYKAILKDQWNL